MHIRIAGFAPASSRGAWEVVVGGDNSATGPGWAYTSADIHGRPPFTQVRLAHDGTANVILLGDLTTAWNGPVIVTDAIVSNFAITGWGSGWSASVLASEAGITNVVTPSIYLYTASTGNVGIGTTSPRSALDVVGTLLAPAAPSNAAPATTAVNFLTGNQQWTSANCASGFKLNNMKDGGTYSLAVKGASSGTCSFNAFSDAGTTALTVHLPTDHGATTASKHTLYSFMVLGTDVYVSWITGY